MAQCARCGTGSTDRSLNGQAEGIAEPLRNVQSQLCPAFQQPETAAVKRAPRPLKVINPGERTVRARSKPAGGNTRWQSSSNLSQASIGEQLAPRHEAAVRRGEKCGSRRDFRRVADMPDQGGSLFPDRSTPEISILGYQPLSKACDRGLFRISLEMEPKRSAADFNLNVNRAAQSHRHKAAICCRENN